MANSNSNIGSRDIDYLDTMQLSVYVKAWNYWDKKQKAAQPTMMQRVRRACSFLPKT